MQRASSVGELDIDVDAAAAYGAEAAEDEVSEEDEEEESTAGVPFFVVKDEEFWKCAGPLALHFFPDGPPSLTQAAAAAAARRNRDAARVNCTCLFLHPKRKSRTAVSARDASRSLDKTLALLRTCTWLLTDGAAAPQTALRRRGAVLTGPQATTLVWVAAEMCHGIIHRQRRSAATTERTAAAITSPLATPQNVCNLLRSIRIVGIGVGVSASQQKDRGPQPHQAATIHRSALLRLASALLLLLDRDLSEAQSAVARFLHLLAVSVAQHPSHNLLENNDGDHENDDHDDESMGPMLTLVVNCCVHERTHPNVRIDVCRLLLCWMHRDSSRDGPHMKKNHHRRFREPFLARYTAVRFRLCLEKLLKEAKANNGALPTTTRTNRLDDRCRTVESDGGVDRWMMTTTKTATKTTTTAWVRRQERSALAAVLRGMASSHPECRDLVLPIPDDNDDIGCRFRVSRQEYEGSRATTNGACATPILSWRVFPEPEWERDFLAAYFQEVDDKHDRQLSFHSTPGPAGATRANKRQRYSQRSNQPSWLARWRSGDSFFGGGGSTSVEVWTTANGSLSTQRQGHPAAKIVEVLKNGDLHHRMILSGWRHQPPNPQHDPSLELSTGGCIRSSRADEMQSTSRPDNDDGDSEDSDADLKRFQGLLPFLLSDYATMVNSSAAIVATRVSASMDPSPASAPGVDVDVSSSSASAVAIIMTTRMESLLAGLNSLALHTDELIPAVQSFVDSRLLPNWDGSDSTLLSIVSYWPPSPFQELHRRVLGRYLEPMLVHGDARLQYRLVAGTLAPLVERWGRKIMDPRVEVDDEQPLATSLERRQVDEKPTVKPADSRWSHDQVRAIGQLVRWVDGVLVKLFVASDDVGCIGSSNEDLLQLAAIRFYTSVGRVQRRHLSCFRDFAVVPSPQIMYRLLLTTSPFIVDRLCQLLHLYQCMLRDVIGSTEDETMWDEIEDDDSSCGIEPTRANNTKEMLRLYKCYVSDACNALWHSGRGGPDATASGSLVTSDAFAEYVVADPGTLSKLQKRISNTCLAANSRHVGDFLGPTNGIESALSLTHGPVFGGCARDFAQQSLSDANREHDDGMKMGDDVDESEPDGIILQGDVGRRYLDYFNKRGFVGIHDLLSCCTHSVTRDE